MKADNQTGAALQAEQLLLSGSKVGKTQQHSAALLLSGLCRLLIRMCTGIQAYMGVCAAPPAQQLYQQS